MNFWRCFCCAFLVLKYYNDVYKKIDKSSHKTGKGYYTYRLCESYRIDNKVRHRTILNVGKLENIRKEDFKFLCDRVQQKEQSMSDKLTKRFAQGLDNIKSSLSKKRGVEQEGAVHRRIGRLHQKYPSISKLYTIELKVDENKTVTDILRYCCLSISTCY